MGDQEFKINLKMNEILKNYGLLAKWESGHEGNKAIDIEVYLADNVRVAVECKKSGSNKRAAAVESASSRLVPMKMVDVALAVVYSKGCNTEDDLTGETNLEYAVVTQANAELYGDDYKAHAKAIEWMNCRVRDLPNIIQHLPENLGDPDRLANDLKIRLTESVRRLTASQRRNLARSINLVYSGQEQNNLDGDAAKRALLVVASASLFHARLNDSLGNLERPEGADSWPPRTLQGCYDAPNTKTSLSEAWGLIVEYDYRPIFESAMNVLAAGSEPVFVEAVKSMARWALDTIGQLGGMRHDLLGRIFHSVIDTASNDGSFYTTTPAAVLLAGLAMRERSDVPDNPAAMRILDPACGTGTLLMAAGERLRELLPDISSGVLIEKILNGVDINVTATHMAATTLGLLSPSTKFSQMNISVAPFGIFDGKARAGSLEMYAEDGLLPYQGWFTGPIRQVETSQIGKIGKHSADLVIMNPPFTRNDIRHDQLGNDVEKKVKEREESIFSKAKDLLDNQLGKDVEESDKESDESAPTETSGQLGDQPGNGGKKPKKRRAASPTDLRYSSDPMFMVLAEHLQKESGTLAVIRPAVVTASPSSHRLRLFLAKKYHIDTIIMPHDPKRFWFSENTNIGEILIVMRRGEKKDTRIINLAVNPGTVTEAAALANQINAGKNEGNYNEVSWPRSLVEKGDWSGVMFYSPYLTNRFMDIRDGKMFAATKPKDIDKTTTKLEDIATVTGPRGVRGAFVPSDNYDSNERYVRYDHKTEEVTAMRADQDKYLITKPGKEEQANKIWANDARLHIVERLQPNITHVIAIKTDDKSVGTSWYSITPRADDVKNKLKDITDDKERVLKAVEDYTEMWSKAMAVYLNSTIGVISLLGIRVPKKPLYPRFSSKDLNSLPLPVMSKKVITRLARTYDVQKDSHLGVWRNPNTTRKKIDKAVCSALGVREAVVGKMRTELAREPMVTGKRYGEQPVIEDYME